MSFRSSLRFALISALCVGAAGVFAAEPAWVAKPGPWGELQVRTVYLEPPENILMPRGFIRLSGFASVLVFTSFTVGAHPGGQDRHGCHMNQATGIYHCHKGPLKGRSFGSEAAMLKALKALRR